ncbi:MAG: NUDIX hydrolase [Bacilli bacterium]|nr:NUDIX hydrolase [Bacilli bacterium]
MKERNIPYVAFRPETGKLIKAGTNIETASKDLYVFPADQKRTLYDGRYCAVSGFVFAVVHGKYSVLANQRGQGTPDYQGCWNCPCGFLECSETSQEGIAREIMEECMVQVDPKRLKVVYVETEPEKCNNGNVTIRHRVFLGKQAQIIWDPNLGLESGGEKDEVESVRWIPLDKVDKYEWAFGHKETIMSLAPRPWIRKILELWYS